MRRRASILAGLLKNQKVEPEVIVTDGVRSYGAALQRLGVGGPHRRGRLHDNSRAENSHLNTRRREGKMWGFKSRASAQLFRETHAAVCNTLKIQRRCARAQNPSGAGRCREYLGPDDSLAETSPS